MDHLIAGTPRWVQLFPHFTDEDVEAQQDPDTCSRSAGREEPPSQESQVPRTLGQRVGPARPSHSPRQPGWQGRWLPARPQLPEDTRGAIHTAAQGLHLFTATPVPSAPSPGSGQAVPRGPEPAKHAPPSTELATPLPLPAASVPPDLAEGAPGASPCPAPEQPLLDDCHCTGPLRAGSWSQACLSVPRRPPFQVHLELQSISQLTWKRAQTPPAHLSCTALPSSPTLRMPSHSHRVGQPLYPPGQARKRAPQRLPAWGHPVGDTGSATRPQSAQSWVLRANALPAEPWRRRDGEAASLPTSSLETSRVDLPGACDGRPQRRCEGDTKEGPAAEGPHEAEVHQQPPGWRESDLQPSKASAGALRPRGPLRPRSRTSVYLIPFYNAVLSPPSSASGAGYSQLHSTKGN